VAKGGLAKRIELRLVQPGTLDFAEDSFDVVFSKDSFIQISDKAEIIGETFRVLKHGGVLAGSDWLGGEGWANSPELKAFRDLAQWTSHLATAPEMAALMENAGFANVSMRDRNSWFIEERKGALERIEGPLRGSIVDIVGEDGYAKWLRVIRASLPAAVAGALRPTHFRAHKP
jgi:phosphoethanolamine N-methyltransferase